MHVNNRDNFCMGLEGNFTKLRHIWAIAGRRGLTIKHKLELWESQGDVYLNKKMFMDGLKTLTKIFVWQSWLAPHIVKYIRRYICCTFWIHGEAFMNSFGKLSDSLKKEKPSLSSTHQPPISSNPPSMYIEGRKDDKPSTKVSRYSATKQPNFERWDSFLLFTALNY